MTDSYDHIFSRIAVMISCHSPSGGEDEIDAYLLRRFAELGHRPRQDPAGNIIVSLPGRGPGRLAITAHKDEIGAIVTLVEDSGRIRLRNLGGSFPWVYGEGVIDLLGESEVVSGILSFGSRHVSHASPQFKFKEAAPLRWADSWVETKRSAAELEQAGVRVGTRAVTGKHRKAPIRLGDHIAGYALDNKASLAILLLLAEELGPLHHSIDLIATAKEEVGAIGALYLTQQNRYDALIALEIAPLSPEYPIVDGMAPVLFVQDSHGLYDEALNASLRRVAAAKGLALQHAVVNGFGSDGSICCKNGHVPRAACLGFPTENTHGFEIAHLGAIANIANLLRAALGEQLF